MKEKLFFCLVFLFSTAAIFSQSDEFDPFEGNYTLLKTCEMGVFLDDTSSNIQLFYDNNEQDSLCIILGDSTAIPKSADLKDLAVGDFDGDMNEELIACYYDESPLDTGIVIYYYDYAQDEPIGTKLLAMSHKYEYGQILVESGNFDADTLQEVVLGYIRDGKMVFAIYNIDDGVIDSLTGIVADTLDLGLGSSARFDFTCEDFDDDGIDEIVCVKSTLLERVKSGGFKATCGFTVEV